jgi:Amt family ammonium transporter
VLFGNPRQLLIQGAAVLAAIVYSGIVSFVLLKVIGLLMPLRASEAEEGEGLDISQHGEEAYIHGGGVTAAAHFEMPQSTSAVVSAPVQASV